MNVDFSNQAEHIFEMTSLALGWLALIVGLLLLRRLQVKLQNSGLRLCLAAAGFFAMSQIIKTFQFYYDVNEALPLQVLELNLQVVTTGFFVTLGISLYQLVKFNQSELQTLKTKADTDKLTGLFTTRSILDTGKQLFEHSVQSGTVFSAIRIRIDDFNSYSDKFGREASNTALKLVGNALASCARTVDVLARYGEEEFMMVMQADKIQSAAIAKRICNAVIEQCSTEKNDQLRQNLTISVGISTRTDESDFKEFIEKASSALGQSTAGSRQFANAH